jgi:hypothetical protein
MLPARRRAAVFARSGTNLGTAAAEAVPSRNPEISRGTPRNRGGHPTRLVEDVVETRRGLQSGDRDAEHSAVVLRGVDVLVRAGIVDLDVAEFRGVRTDDRSSAE